MDRDFSGTVMARAFEHYQAGQLEQAARLYDDVLTSFPEDAEALDLSGIVALSRGDLAQAVARTSCAAEIGDLARYHGNHGVALGQMGQHEAAADAYARALALHPDYPEAHNNRGISLARLGQVEPAMEAFRRAIALRPDYADAWMNLGDAFQAQNRLRDAIAAYERGLTHNPRAPRAAPHLSG